MKAIVLAVILLVLTGCTTTGRLYNTTNGEVSHATFVNNGTGHGAITVTQPDGSTLTGEYSTISGMSMTNSFAFGSANTTGSGNFSGSFGRNHTNFSGTTDFSAYTYASAQGFSFTTPGVQYGSAMLAGVGGLLVEIVYQVDPWTSHGYGYGVDNKGNKYRVQF